MIEINTFSPEETEQVGENLARKLKGTEIIALYGEMGAGKTAFVRGVARGLGINDGVSSPTFAIVHEYDGKYRLYHFDMFRVETWDDLYSTGFFDYIGNGVLIIEWSENIESIIPESSLKITIRQKSVSKRIIIIEGIDEFWNY